MKAFFELLCRRSQLAHLGYQAGMHRRHVRRCWTNHRIVHLLEAPLQNRPIFQPERLCRRAFGIRVEVDGHVVEWLEASSARLSEDYEVDVAGQIGSWVFYRARFVGGFEMECRFRGAAPATADLCVEVVD